LAPLSRGRVVITWDFCDGGPSNGGSAPIVVQGSAPRPIETPVATPQVPIATTTPTVVSAPTTPVVVAIPVPTTSAVVVVGAVPTGAPSSQQTTQHRPAATTVSSSSPQDTNTQSSQTRGSPASSLASNIQASVYLTLGAIVASLCLLNL
jgi:hypothetical protein